MDEKAIEIDYTNWRGERAWRTVIPYHIVYESNSWHPEKQWLMMAYDPEKDSVRSFALAGIHGFRPTTEGKQQ